MLAAAIKGHLAIRNDNAKLGAQLDLVSLAFDGPACTATHKIWLSTGAKYTTRHSLAATDEAHLLSHGTPTDTACRVWTIAVRMPPKVA